MKVYDYTGKPVVWWLNPVAARPWAEGLNGIRKDLIGRIIKMEKLAPLDIYHTKWGNPDTSYPTGRVDNKPAEQLRLTYGGDNCNTLANQSEHPVAEGLLERILSSENLRAALKQVERNKGSAGVDGMPVTKLREHLKKHWQKLRASILDGTYRPSPALRIEIPKPNKA
jgi:hypothetical protein